MNRCARGPACAAWEIHTQPDGSTVRLAALCDRPLCDLCTARAEQALNDAPELYRQLRGHTLLRNQGGETERVSRSAGSPMPLNAAALHLGEQLRALLEHGEDTVRGVAQLTPAVRAGKREGRRVADAAHFLSLRLTAWITADTDGATAMLAWRATVRRLPGLDPTGPRAVRRYDEPCMYCAVKAVTHQAGDDHVQCQACGARWDRDLYAVKAAAFADHLKRIGHTG